MLRGHILLALDKVVMFGIAGSGKTSALAVLLGDDPPDVRSSTPLMKRPIEVLFMEVDDKLEWKIRTLQEVRDSIAEVIHSRMPKQQAEPLGSVSLVSPSQQPSPATSSQSFQPAPEKEDVATPEAAGEVTPSPKKKPTGTVVEVSLDSLLKSTEVDEEFVSLINTSPPSSEPILRLRQTLVLDSGGQPQFHELMPVFLYGASDFVYVFKVHESLEIRMVIRYFREGKLVYEFVASQTNEDTLKQCTRTMTSLSAKNTDMPLARLLFLATHRDMVAEGELPGVLESLHKKLREILLPQFEDQIIYCDENMESFIFTMNAAKPVKKDRECAEAIRRCLSGKREGSKVVNVPLRWYALYHKLLEVVEGLGKKVLSREQCGLVAVSMHIEEESCEEALMFFNGLNMLFYFPDILPNLVFMEPQMLLDKVTELVEESYRMSQGKKDQQVKPKQGEWKKFRDYGQVTKKFLSEFKSHYEEPLFTPNELITLLRELLVFADLSEDVYFMPCLLQVVTAEVVAEYRVSGEKALALHFPDSGPLMGMFCSTVAYLLSPHNAHPRPWEVVQEAGTPKCLNRNVIQFTIPKVTGAISLIDHFTHFEIHICTHPKKAAQLWKMAHDAVFSGLEKARKTLGYTNNTPVSSIVCPAHPTPPHNPHPATIDNDHVWTCSSDPLKYGDLAEGTIPWLTVCNTHTEAKGGSKKTSSVEETGSPYPTAAAVPDVSTTPSSSTPLPHPPSLPAAVPDVSTSPSSTEPQPHPPPLPAAVPGASGSLSSTEPYLPTLPAAVPGIISSADSQPHPLPLSAAVPDVSNSPSSTAPQPHPPPLSAVRSSPSSTEPLPLPLPSHPDTQPTLQQLTYMVAPSGKEVRIIKNIAAKWKTVGALFNFDPTGYTIDLINTHNQSKPMACCTDMMKKWLGGEGRQPANWATLVEVLKNAEFNTLANEVEQLVTKSGRNWQEDGEIVSVEDNKPTASMLEEGEGTEVGEEHEVRIVDEEDLNESTDDFTTKSDTTPHPITDPPEESGLRYRPKTQTSIPVLPGDSSSGLSTPQRLSFLVLALSSSILFLILILIIVHVYVYGGKM